MKMVFCSGGNAQLFPHSLEDVFISIEEEPVLFDTDIVSAGDIFTPGIDESIDADGNDLNYSRNGIAQRLCSVYENLYARGSPFSGWVIWMVTVWRSDSKHLGHHAVAIN